MKKFKTVKSRTSLWRESRHITASMITKAEDHSIDDDVSVIQPPCDMMHELSDDSDVCDTFDDVMYYSVDSNSEVVCDNTVGLRWMHGSDFESYNEDICYEAQTDINHDLAEWVVKHNIPRTAVGSLLSVLRPHLPSLPQDYRTLLRTPTQHCVTPIDGGEKCYLGLANGLRSFVEKYDVHEEQLILQVNVDGIPLFKSSTVTLWPILCLVKNVGIKEPFVVSMFCGNQKPGSASEYLSDFVEEACQLIKNGLTIGLETKRVTVHSFVCDAPARAFVKGTKCHSGYYSCEKCTVRGDYDGKVIFPVGQYRLRTDEDFAAMIDEGHHVEACPLNPLPVGFVTQFGLDYMHLACLGVMRRLLLYWKGPVGPLEVRLGRKLLCDLSLNLLHLSSFIPIEFARKPRSVDDVHRWKATEFREFMLYTGVVVLCKILPDHLYQHFMLLFVSMRLLVSRHLCLQYCDYADQLLTKFVHDGKCLYGTSILVYNVHCLIHLANDVKNLGCLEDFSAFVFENKLGQLKKLVRKPQQPLQQILRRLHEQNCASVCEILSTEPTVRTVHCDGPLLPGFMGATQYRHVKTVSYTLSVDIGNNCILIAEGVPVLVKNILKAKEQIVLICLKFKTVSDAFLYPLPSSQLSIFQVEGECTELFSVYLSDVQHKCACFPRHGLTSFIVLPLLH